MAESGHSLWRKRRGVQIEPIDARGMTPAPRRLAITLALVGAALLAALAAPRPPIGRSASASSSAGTPSACPTSSGRTRRRRPSASASPWPRTTPRRWAGATWPPAGSRRATSARRGSRTTSRCGGWTTASAPGAPSRSWAAASGAGWRASRRGTTTTSPRAGPTCRPGCRRWTRPTCSAHTRAGAIGSALRPPRELVAKYPPPAPEAPAAPAGAGGRPRPRRPAPTPSPSRARAPPPATPILLGNPHLRWSQLYWEAHVTVPGRLDFYGSTLVGLPMLRAGFNDRLGYVQTNNDPDLEDIVALPLDPARPGHYLFDGRSLPDPEPARHGRGAERRRLGPTGEPGVRGDAPRPRRPPDRRPGLRRALRGPRGLAPLRGVLRARPRALAAASTCG